MYYNYLLPDKEKCLSMCSLRAQKKINLAPHLKLVSGISVTETDLREALRLDKIVYDKFDEGQFNIEKCLAWYSINPDIYFILKDLELDTVVGYVNLVPIEISCYNKIASGSIWDTAIEDSNVLPYNHPGLYHLYFTSIAVNPLYRNMSTFLNLIDAVASKLTDLSKREIYFKAMIADAVTPVGEKICRIFGMNLIKKTNHDSRVYEISFIPPSFRRSSASLNSLAEIYEQLIFDVEGAY